MAYYSVSFQTVASATVKVEADDQEAAIELAYDGLPYAPAFSDYEFGEWEISSEFQRVIGDPNPSTEWDVEEIDEKTFLGRW